MLEFLLLLSAMDGINLPLDNVKGLPECSDKLSIKCLVQYLKQNLLDLVPPFYDVMMIANTKLYSLSTKGLTFQMFSSDPTIHLVHAVAISPVIRRTDRWAAAYPMPRNHYDSSLPCLGTADMSIINKEFMNILHLCHRLRCD